MRLTTLFALLYCIFSSLAFGGRMLPNYDSLESRIVPLPEGERYIGVYGITGASHDELPARMALNHRVDYLIETGEPFDGSPLQVLDRRNLEGRFDVLRPANRAVLMFLRLYDIQGDIDYWRNEACLDLGSDRVVDNSLIDWVIHYIRVSLGAFDDILTDEQLFTHLIGDGIDANADDFTNDEYERMHGYFRRYVDFVQQVLNPWRDAWGGGDSNPLLQGLLWGRRIGEVFSFRLYAQDQMRIHPRDGGIQETEPFFAEADARINATQQSPLHALIGMVLMEAMLNGMHGVWAELRDTLNDEGHDDMACYRMPERADREDPEDAVFRRLATLNGLLQPEMLLQIQGYHQNQQVFNGNVVMLYRMIRNHMLSLYRYTNTATRREGDWTTFLQTGDAIDAFIESHFALIAPLDFEEEDEADGRDEDVHPGVGDGGYLDQDERAWWQVYGTNGRFPGARDSNDTDGREDEIDYPDEEEDSMELSADDDEGNRDDGGVIGFRVNGETYFLTTETVRTALAAALIYLNGFDHHSHAG